ncbi:MAG: response regulator, partial [Oligoflexia bacterium]|nr:response regulator [Oligoflexia bacterium]
FCFKGRVLVMDDEVSLLTVFRSFFTKLGADVVEVTNGQDAIVAFKKAVENGTPFSIVMLDLTVQGAMGGKETIHELRKIANAKDVHFLAIASSGYSNDPIFSNPKEYGFDSSISKPFTKADLENMLGLLFGHL